MSKSVIPPGKAGLVVLAAALTPIVLRKMRPVTRAVGKGLAKVGDMLIKTAEEPHDPVKTESVDVPPKPEPKKATSRPTRATATTKPKPSASKSKAKPKPAQSS
ncbi:MAG TPA: hypothetical protein PKA27_05325 [Fimbriimonadaceae bacterium]|nr:hypothetical protein [Fimbriimonadaceae bacterium]